MVFLAQQIWLSSTKNFDSRFPSPTKWEFFFVCNEIQNIYLMQRQRSEYSVRIMDGLDNAVLKSAEIVNFSSIQSKHIGKILNIAYLIAVTASQMCECDSISDLTCVNLFKMKVASKNMPDVYFVRLRFYFGKFYFVKVYCVRVGRFLSKIKNYKKAFEKKHDGNKHEF